MPEIIPDVLGAQLHDRLTRGEMLSADERDQLDQWYARHDQEEAFRLAAAKPAELAELQEVVRLATTRLVTQAQSLQAITEDNARLRREIATLQGQLAAKRKAQPA